LCICAAPFSSLRAIVRRVAFGFSDMSGLA
jgi:hypothetical protein